MKRKTEIGQNTWAERFPLVNYGNKITQLPQTMSISLFNNNNSLVVVTHGVYDTSKGNDQMCNITMRQHRKLKTQTAYTQFHVMIETTYTKNDVIAFNYADNQHTKWLRNRISICRQANVIWELIAFHYADNKPTKHLWSRWIIFFAHNVYVDT